MAGSDEPTSGLSDERDAHQTEWETARALLQATDANLHDLRKFGFSFVTALLAAEAILLPYVPTSSGSTGVPDVVKLGAFLVTMLLIYVLHLIDENYLVLEEATATRALVLERELNIELTDIITARYAKNQVKRRVLLVYTMFALGVWGLGVFVFSSSPNLTAKMQTAYIDALFIGLILVIIGFLTTRYGVKVNYAFQEKRDWTVGPLNCEEGDEVKITLTNLDTSRASDEEMKTLLPA